jgi:hypothetical protein
VADWLCQARLRSLSRSLSRGSLISAELAKKQWVALAANVITFRRGSARDFDGGGRFQSHAARFLS